MKSRPKPRPTKYRLPSGIAKDPQVAAWTKRLLADPDARPTDLSEDQLAFVITEVMKRRPGFEPTAFQKAMIETCPILAAPDFTGLEDDLGHIFAQPEMLAFWRSWDGPKKGRENDPDYAGAKALMSLLAIGGRGPFFDDPHEQLGRDAALRQLFGTIEATAAGNPVGAPIAVPPYASAMRHVHAAAPSCWWEAMRTNIELVRQIAALNPDGGVGRRLLIDGTAIPAWCPQRGARGDGLLDAFYRRRTPEAGFRMYLHSRHGKTNVSASAQLAPALINDTSRKWRGYYLVVIADQATGLPLVWTLHDAAQDEARSLLVLLRDLYELWPDIPAEVIAGDSAWDEDEWCRVCEVNYGLAPVFRLHPSRRDKGGRILKQGESRDDSIRAISGEGQLICAAHGRTLEYDTADRPTRVDRSGRRLRAGQENREAGFRLRGLCNHSAPGAPPCGRVGLRMRSDWSALTTYPHHGHGDPRRYAMRLALQLRLNQSESLFHRLKSGGLGTAGAARTRTLAKGTAEALLSLRLLSMSALALADERAQRGITRALPKVAAGAVSAQATAAASAASAVASVGGAAGIGANTTPAAGGQGSSNLAGVAGAVHGAPKHRPKKPRRISITAMLAEPARPSRRKPTPAGRP